MKLPNVYLHALGMINALGADTAQIATALAATRDQLVRLVRWHSPSACEGAG